MEKVFSSSNIYYEMIYIRIFCGFWNKYINCGFENILWSEKSVSGGSNIGHENSLTKHLSWKNVSVSVQPLLSNLLKTDFPLKIMVNNCSQDLSYQRIWRLLVGSSMDMWCDDFGVDVVYVTFQIRLQEKLERQKCCQKFLLIFLVPPLPVDIITIFFSFVISYFENWDIFMNVAVGLIRLY